MIKRLFGSKKDLTTSVLGINQRNVELIYKYNQRKHYKYADDKSETKRILESNGLSCPKTYALISNIGDIESTWAELNQYSSLVIKPAKGSGGGGILVLKKVNNEWFQGSKEIPQTTIFFHIANILFGVFSFGDTDKCIIEECITPDPFFGQLYPEGVPDIRIITVERKPVMAMLRLPTSASDGKANLHQGGLGVGIDMETGILTDTYDGSQFITHHPDSQNLITGMKIPDWDEIMKLSTKVAEVFPLNYMGIDIVIDKKMGPSVLEINVRPGLGIQMANKKGLKSEIIRKLK